tara:strand:- start:1427 stop:1789 length:363 start_codon:yes stop_codon:yes gene_type:complete
MLKNKTFISLFLISVLFTACASQPDKISSQYVPAATYSNYTCDQIASSLRQKNNRMQTLYGSLKEEADADEWQMGVGMILFWPSLFFLEGGDSPESAEYARIKGEVDALNEMSIQKNCGY